MLLKDNLAEKDFLPNIKSLVARLNLSAQGSDMPMFKLKHNELLPTRSRGGELPTLVEFSTDDTFRISLVFVEKEPRHDEFALKILTILSPADLKNVSSYSSITLPLDRVISDFEGAEDWFESVKSERARSPLSAQKTPKLPTVEQTRNSDAWGSW